MGRYVASKQIKVAGLNHDARIKRRRPGANKTRTAVPGGVGVFFVFKLGGAGQSVNLPVKVSRRSASSIGERLMNVGIPSLPADVETSRGGWACGGDGVTLFVRREDGIGLFRVGLGQSWGAGSLGGLRSSCFEYGGIEVVVCGREAFFIGILG